jgi:hypothetical protein
MKKSTVAVVAIPGTTHLSDYLFQHIIPIECTPDLRDENSGEAVYVKAVWFI